jgi:hypothetical protein
METIVRLAAALDSVHHYVYRIQAVQSEFCVGSSESRAADTVADSHSIGVSLQVQPGVRFCFEWNRFALGSRRVGDAIATLGRQLA